MNTSLATVATHSNASSFIPSLREDNSVDKYVAEIRKHKLLTREEELALATRLQDDGDVAAAHQLVVSNLRFVVKIAHEFRGYNMKLLDLIQEGNVGLMMAVKKFDPTRGYRLISYAVWWIRAYMRSFIMRTWSSVKLGTTHASRKLFFKLRSTKSRMEQEDGEQPSTEELARELGVTESDVFDMEMRMAARDFSLDADRGDSQRAFVDRLPSAEDNQEEVYAHEEEKQLASESVRQAMATLSEKERYIVEQRFLKEDPRTLNDIGAEFGVSRERVRQLEARAMGKLRKHLSAALPSAN
jgi:RNA polymerase sigma-32 factor